jgi:lantibiotic modifying enzyme
MTAKTVLQVRSLLQGSSHKQISLTQASAPPQATQFAPAQTQYRAAKLTMAARHFDASLGCLVRPALDELAAQLSSIKGLSARERDVITNASRESLYAVLHNKLSRLLVLELNSARETARLTAQNSEERWQQFLELSSQRSFWDDLAVHYPSLLQ